MLHNYSPAIVEGQVQDSCYLLSNTVWRFVDLDGNESIPCWSWTSSDWGISLNKCYTTWTPEKPAWNESSTFLIQQHFAETMG